MTSETLFIRFADLDDVNAIGFLAQQIWPKTYGKIVPQEQLDYMLNLFYNPASLRRQMKEDKHLFLMLEQGDEPIGFASWSEIPEEDAGAQGIFKLHKLYVLSGRQGKGMGKAMLNFIFDDIRGKGAKALRLNVNRYNSAIAFYEKMGFKIILEEDVPIGNNYFMNDYVMEVPVPEAGSANI